MGFVWADKQVKNQTDTDFCLLFCFILGFTILKASNFRLDKIKEV